ncbi:MAG: small ribosomal subunit Rsm22 family protein [Myxococcales bacterium]
MNIVLPLEESWRGVLDAVAREHRWPTSRDPERLGASVAALSASYNGLSDMPTTGERALAARLGFSFARDVPKAAAAVREVVCHLGLDQETPVRLLDVGAGLGAMTWGVLRALRGHGHAQTMEALWMDTDARALALGQAIVEHSGQTALQVRHLVQRVHAPAGRFHLVLMGQVLSELDRELEPNEDKRADRHADLLMGFVDLLTPDGALVVVEPALRDRTRHLHRVRDRLVTRGVPLFAPCLHDRGCPMLETRDDWCHEKLAVDLPSWLVPVARVAGLRYQGLTFSYAVFRRSAGKVGDRLGGAGKLRVVSDLLRTKGKREVLLCGDLEGRCLVRTTRLDRDGTLANATFETLSRGELVRVEGATCGVQGFRIERTTLVERSVRESPGNLPQARGLGTATVRER